MPSQRYRAVLRAKKKPAIPAEDGIDSEAESEAPAAETEETDEKGSGGFRVRIYE